MQQQGTRSKTMQRGMVCVLVALSTMWLAGCGHYTCGTTFGNASCNASGSGFQQGGGSSASAAYVYAVDQGLSGASNGTIDGFAFNATTVSFGGITNYTAPVVPLNQGGVGMTVAQKQFLYTGFGASNQIYGWTIGADGSLTTITGSPFTAPGLGGYISGVGQDNMVTNPAGSLLFYSDAVGSAIYVFQISSTGVLTEVGSGFPAPAGFTPMNLSTDGLGKFLYVIDGSNITHQGSSLAVYSIGTGNSLGQLTQITGSPFTTIKMWQLQGDPTGQFMVGTTGTTVLYNGLDDKSLYVFSIGSTGALTQVAQQVTANAPFSIAVQPNSAGNLVYSFGFNDTGSAFNPIEGFTIGSGGTLTAASGEPYSIGEGSWGQFDQSGSLLFTYASFLDVSTNTLTTQVTPLVVGAGGALTEPTSFIDLTTPGFWVVTDAP